MYVRDVAECSKWKEHLDCQPANGTTTCVTDAFFTSKRDEQGCTVRDIIIPDKEYMRKYKENDDRYIAYEYTTWIEDEIPREYLVPGENTIEYAYERRSDDGAVYSFPYSGKVHCSRYYVNITELVLSERY